MAEGEEKTIEEKTNFTDFEMVEDLLESVATSPDMQFADDDIKEETEKHPEGTLLKVEKEIASPIKILSVTEVTDSLVEKEIGIA